MASKKNFTSSARRAAFQNPKMDKKVTAIIKSTMEVSKMLNSIRK